MLNDKVVLRAFQEDGRDKIIGLFIKGQRIATANPFPGSGKTILSFSVGLGLYRLGRIDSIVHMNPRVALCQQFSQDWAEIKHKFADPKFKSFAIGSNPTDFSGYAPKLAVQALCRNEENGYSICFASVSSNPEFHEDYAINSRSLLIIDEAQYLGVDPRTGESSNKMTKAMDRLQEHYPYILVMGGTSRGGGEKVWGVEYTAPNRDGVQFPKYDVTASYVNGISNEYLRQMQFRMPDSTGIWNKLMGESEEMTISNMASKLGRFLQEPEYYQHLIDLSVEELNQVRVHDRRFGMLIAAFDQKQARKAQEYLASKYPHLTSNIAVSDDGPKSLDALNSYRSDECIDVLITVRQAFIGYSCKRLIVLCCLTNYREFGFLDQLMGRVLRVMGDVPYYNQIARIVMPCDILAVEYAEQKRKEVIEGIKLKEEKEPPKGADQVIKDEEDEQPGVMSDLKVLDARLKGVEEGQDIDGATAEFLRYRFKNQIKKGIPETIVLDLLREAGLEVGSMMSQSGFVPSTHEPDLDLESLRQDVVYRATGKAGDSNQHSLAAYLRSADRSLDRQSSCKCAWFTIKKELGDKYMRPKFADRETLVLMRRFLQTYPRLLGGPEKVRALVGEWFMAQQYEEVGNE